jgi:hypothetical protein
LNKNGSQYDTPKTITSSNNSTQEIVSRTRVGFFLPDEHVQEEAIKVADWQQSKQ